MPQGPEARTAPVGCAVYPTKRNGITPMSPTVIRVKVKPNARTSALTQLADGSWVAQVKAPAIEGRANRELIALVAEHFQCVKAAVLIKTGVSKRLKVIRIEMLTDASAERRRS